MKKKIIGLNRFIVLSIITVLVIIFIFLLLSKKQDSVRSISSSPQLNDHPIYSRYNFNENSSKINLGIQPLYLPTGIIFEAVKRDEILKTALAEFDKEIAYFSFLKGADVNYFLQKDLLDGGVGGDMPALSAAASFDVTIPVKIQKGNVSIVSRKPALTKDLKGKRIGYPYGSISHYYILELLNSAEISEAEVKLMPMEVSQMAEALYKKKIDLFTAWEPSVTEAMELHPDFYITFKKITSGYLYFSKMFFQENPRINELILSAVIRSVNWLKSDRENLLLACEWNLAEMEILTGKKSSLSPSLLADLALKDILGYIPRFVSMISEEDISENSILHKEYEFIMNLANNTKKLNWQDVKKSFNNKMIKNILADPAKYQLKTYDYKEQ